VEDVLVEVVLVEVVEEGEGEDVRIFFLLTN
jgi:hypothetical protein